MNNKTIASPKSIFKKRLLLVSMILLICSTFSYSSESKAQTAAYPTSCLAAHNDGATADQEYTLFSHSKLIQIYCANMNTSNPWEYITLPSTGGSYNYSKHAAGGARPGIDVITHFNKIRIDLSTLVVNTMDLTFSNTTGFVSGGPTNMPYGDAEDCFADNSSLGTANINLLGTSFTVDPNQFFVHGWPTGNGSTGYSSNNQIVNLTGGGYCGSNNTNTTGDADGGTAMQLSLLTESVATPALSAFPLTTTSGSVTVTIVYPENAVQRKYKIGSNGAYQDYTAPFSVSANDTISAYAVDGSANVSDFGSIAVTNIDKSSTTVLSTSNSNSTYGGSVTFTASVTGYGGTPSGTVTFKDGATTLGTGTLNGSGQATFAFGGLSVDSHSISAVYEGAGNFAGSTSSASTQTINKAIPGIQLESSAPSSTWSHSVILTVYVDSSTGVIPTGIVSFRDGNVIVKADVSLNAEGKATWTTNNLALGTHEITVHYSGEANFDSKDSVIFNQVIVPFTDEEAVTVDSAALLIGYSNGDSVTNVTYHLTLPTSGPNGTLISWSSNAANIINSSGQITRPAFDAGNMEVTLTAHISRGSSPAITQSKSFVVNVIRSWDVNRDGVVSIDDIVRLIKLKQDGNQDSIFNENDIEYYLNQIEPLKALNIPE